MKNCYFRSPQPSKPQKPNKNHWKINISTPKTAIHTIYTKYTSSGPSKYSSSKTLPAFPGLPLDPPGSRPASSNLPQSPWCPKTSENHFNLMKTNENSMRINEKQWKSKKINENHWKINAKLTFSRPQPPPASPSFPGFPKLTKINKNQWTSMKIQ